MDFTNKLFKYTYTEIIQGTPEKGEEYALLHVPQDAKLANNKGTLYAKRNQDFYHEIDYDSITDLTINF